MYPQAVEQALDKVVDGLHNIGFFEQEDCEVCYVREEFGKVLFQQWLSGGEFEISVEMAKELLNRAILFQTLDSMQERGLIDCIEDENGEEMVFLTEKGKKVDFESLDKQDLDILNKL